MTLPVNVERSRVFTPEEMVTVAADDAEEATYLTAMLAKAKEYITAFAWCPGISSVYFGGGIGKVIAAFLMELEDIRPSGVDEWLWVVVGDIPSAFLVTDGAPDGPSALRVYCDLMDDWVNAVRNGRNMSEVFPVKAPATKEHVDLLTPRLATIREEMIPQIELQVIEAVRTVARRPR